jgi:predicted permease
VQGSSGDLQSALHAEGGRGTASARTLRWRGVIVVAEVTLACTLLVAAGLLARSFAALVRTDPGFEPSGAVAFDLFLPQAGYPEPGHVAAFHARLEQRLRALPGVRAAGATTALPWSGWDENTDFGIPGDRRGLSSEPSARFGAASAGFFDAVGLSLKQGRLFTASDAIGAPRVVVVNEAFARKYFPGEDPVGRTLEIWGQKPVIVGVVGDVKDAPADVEAKPAFLWPLAQQPFSATTVAVRAEAPAGLYEGVRAAVAAIDPELPIANLRPLAEVARDAHARRRFLLSMVAAFAALALLLAAVGAYGVLSYAVERRRREIGIRLVLGADSGRILRDVLGHSLGLAVRGVALGLALALVLAHLMQSLLYGVTARDPMTLLAAATTILLVSALAALHPAWRATRAQPARILRAE